MGLNWQVGLLHWLHCMRGKTSLLRMIQPRFILFDVVYNTLPSLKWFVHLWLNLNIGVSVVGKHSLKTIQ